MPFFRPVSCAVRGVLPEVDSVAELFPRINTGKKTTGDDFLRSFQGGTVIAKSLERECTFLFGSSHAVKPFVRSERTPLELGEFADSVYGISGSSLYTHRLHSSNRTGRSRIGPLDDSIRIASVQSRPIYSALHSPDPASLACRTLNPIWFRLRSAFSRGKWLPTPSQPRSTNCTHLHSQFAPFLAKKGVKSLNSVSIS